MTLNKYLLTCLILMALTTSVNATTETFESGLGSWTSGAISTTQAHSGTHSLIPFQGTSLVNMSIPQDSTLSFYVFIPNAARANNMFQAYLYTSNRWFEIDQSYPTSGYWGVHQDSGYVNAGFYVDADIWRHVEVVRKNDIASFYIDGTLLYSNSTGITGTYSPHIAFYRGNSPVYVDDIELKNNTLDISGYWNTTVTTDSTTAYITSCVGNSGGYYKLKSTSGTILRSSILNSSICMSSTEDLAYLYTLESGNWIAYSTLPNDTVMSFSSFNVDPTPTPTPSPSPSPTPTVSPTPTPNTTQQPSINYNIGALIDGTNLNIHACAGSSRGYFYMIAPNNQHKYATYVGEYSCTDFSLPLSDMIISGGAGNWTLAIFDESDLSQSKAYYQVLISDGVVILFTSNPSGANVYVNSTFKGITPFNLNAGNQTQFHFRFNKSGYVDSIFDSHITTSTTVNANLNIIPTPTPSQDTTPGWGNNNNNNNNQNDKIASAIRENSPLLIALIATALFTVIGIAIAGGIGGALLGTTVLMVGFILEIVPKWILIIYIILLAISSRMFR